MLTDKKNTIIKNNAYFEINKELTLPLINNIRYYLAVSL
ncbi:hypothetical protein MNV_800004 [Candidatus Methanoperedens nitroreducens]|uniref:Uncharacterized protein n=1 Tax=Candidatus Methanoperedens nitratireducens TaxID=1392998 RepID=A0A284VU03_9EURY|nr:hypothetical protein MNV_800004 [Candidatus Methanoperedens nitroreducens]